jgi:Arc/MetJ-type ribon-helix-helix transcriptional regulator
MSKPKGRPTSSEGKLVTVTASLPPRVVATIEDMVRRDKDPNASRSNIIRMLVEYALENGWVPRG